VTIDVAECDAIAESNSQAITRVSASTRRPGLTSVMFTKLSADRSTHVLNVT